MASECHWEERDRWLMSIGVARNMVVLLLAAAVSVMAASWFVRNASAESIRDVISELWVVQGLLVGAILALIYRLSSDTAGIKGMKAAQRRLLDEMATRKAYRLWALAVLVVAPAVLVRISDRFESPQISDALLWVAIALGVFSTTMAGYLPSIWNELRRFVTQLVADNERDERTRAQLSNLDGSKK